MKYFVIAKPKFTNQKLNTQDHALLHRKCEAKFHTVCKTPERRMWAYLSRRS